MSTVFILFMLVTQAPGDHMLIGEETVAKAVPKYKILWFTDPSHCIPCQHIVPTIDRMKAANYPITTYVVDTPQGKKFKITSVPTMVVTRNGVEVARAEGELPPATYCSTYNDAVTGKKNPSSQPKQK